MLVMQENVLVVLRNNTEVLGEVDKGAPCLQINSEMALKFKNLSVKDCKRKSGNNNTSVIPSLLPTHPPPKSPMAIRPWTHLSFPSSSEGGDSSSLPLSQYHFSRPESETPFREGVSRHCIHSVQFLSRALGAYSLAAKGLEADFTKNYMQIRAS